MHFYARLLHLSNFSFHADNHDQDTLLEEKNRTRDGQHYIGITLLKSTANHLHFLLLNAFYSTDEFFKSNLNTLKHHQYLLVCFILLFYFVIYWYCISALLNFYMTLCNSTSINLSHKKVSLGEILMKCIRVQHINHTKTIFVFQSEKIYNLTYTC